MLHSDYFKIKEKNSNPWSITTKCVPQTNVDFINGLRPEPTWPKKMRVTLNFFCTEFAPTLKLTVPDYDEVIRTHVEMLTFDSTHWPSLLQNKLKFKFKIKILWIRFIQRLLAFYFLVFPSPSALVTSPNLDGAQSFRTLFRMFGVFFYWTNRFSHYITH